LIAIRKSSTALSKGPIYRSRKINRVQIDDSFVLQETFEKDINIVMRACSKLQKASNYANPKKGVFFAP